MAAVAKKKKLTPSLENYLEAILILERTGRVARVRDIAKRLEVGMPSVTAALKTLAKRDMVNYDPYQVVTLTAMGRQAAERVSGRHQAIRRFLTDVLGLDSESADANACRMEHSVDEKLMRRLSEFAEFIHCCPRAGQGWIDAFYKSCSNGINPDLCPECLAETVKQFRSLHKEQGNAMIRTLADIKPGQKARITRIAGAAAANRRLVDMGLVRNTVVSVLRVAPLGDPMEIKVRGYNLSLRKAEAEGIEVE
ncbi:MAG: metal-dependent transcriptional regulator [Planctomycetota bacterium]|nr:metal-dependent transcriptional regulator [Planctomycetota bacterium]